MVSGKKLPISVVVLTFNEEANIERCLASVVEAFDEVFVVDSYSRDRTKELALKFLPANVFFEREFLSYSDQRNWAQTSLPITNKWVLHLDADESVDSKLGAELQRRFASEPEVDGFLVPVKVVFMGRFLRHGFLYPVYHNRLYRMGSGECDNRKWDNHFIIRGRTARLQRGLDNVVSPDITTWVMRHIKQASLVAQEIVERRNGAVATIEVEPKFLGSPIQRRKWLRYRLYNRLPKFVRPVGFFIFRYVFCLGFLDGKEGFIYHAMHAWVRILIDVRIEEMEREVRGLRG